MAGFVLQITGKSSSHEGVLRGLTEPAGVNHVVGNVLDTVTYTLLGLAGEGRADTEIFN